MIALTWEHFKNTLDLRGTHHVHTNKDSLHPIAKYIIAGCDWRGVNCADIAGCAASAQLAFAGPALT